MFQRIHAFWRRISSGPRERQGMALLRVGTGLFFLYQGHHKLTDPQFEAHLLEQLKLWTQTNPFPLYKSFLQQVVFPHLHQFANLVTDGEILVGVSYVLGFLVPLGAWIAILLNLNFLLAMQHSDPSALPMNLLFLLVSFALFWGKAGKQFGLDQFMVFSFGSGKGQPRRNPVKKQPPRQVIRKTGKPKPTTSTPKTQAPPPRPRAVPKAPPEIQERPANVRSFARSPERPIKAQSAKVKKLETVLKRETSRQKPTETPIKPAPAPKMDAIAEAEAPPKVVKIFDHRSADDDD